MKTPPGLKAIILSTMLAAALLAGCYPPQATTASPIAARDVWARAAVAMPGAAPAGEQMPQDMTGGQMAHGGANSAIFLTLTNRGPAADRLVAAQAAVSEAVEIHETRMEGDVMMMRQVTGGIEIPAGGQVDLKPGGYHIMLIGLTKDLVASDKFLVTLQFANAAPLTVEAEVRQP